MPSFTMTSNRRKMAKAPGEIGLTYSSRNRTVFSCTVRKQASDLSYRHLASMTLSAVHHFAGLVINGKILIDDFLTAE
jgi:hypothetical protein